MYKTSEDHITKARLHYEKITREMQAEIAAVRRRRLVAIAKMNLDIMDYQEHDRRAGDNTCHTTRRY